MVSILFLALILHHPALPQERLSQPDEAVLEDIVVTGVPNAPPFDPFIPFRSVCFDGNRLNGGASRPELDAPLWIPLDTVERQRLGVTDDAVKLYRQERADLSLVLKIDEAAEGRLTRNHCSLTIIGVHDQDDLVRRMSATFSAPGLRKHVGQIEGYEPIPDWEQLAWTAIPHKRTSQWNATGGYVVVTDPSFYRNAAHIIGNLKYTAGGAVPVSELALTYRFRT